MRVFWFCALLCLWSDQSGLMALFYGFNLWSVPGFIFESCVSFKCSYSHFPVYIRRLEPFSGEYLN
jgi:integral membrane sensor domain MASE1